MPTVNKNSKFPSYPLATVAFQKVSFAYETLSTPSSRRLYDAHVPDASSSPSSFYYQQQHSGASPGSFKAADETLTSVLVGVFCDFMEGDFGMLRTFLSEFRNFCPRFSSVR